MYPDVVSLLRAYLLPVVTPTQVVSRIPDPRPQQLVQIRRVGGTELRPVRDRARVDAFCWAPDELAAYALADTVRVAVHQLAGTDTLGPAVYRVDELLGPRFDDDPLTSTPRVWVTYTLDVRADDAIAH